MKKFQIIMVFLCTVMLLVPCFIIPASALTIYDGNFGYELNVSTMEAKLIDYNGTDTEITVPAYYRQFPVTSIDEYTFKGNTQITSITLPVTLKTVADESFMNCTALKSFTLPENVETIGRSVFRGCTSLETVVFEPFLYDLPDYTFADCTALKEVYLNFRFRNIGEGAFLNCSSLSEPNFFPNVFTVQAYSFAGTALESVVIPDTLTYLPDNSFTNCASLKEITIPKTVTFVEPNAFDKRDDMTIYCYYATPGYDFAVLNGLHYVLLDEYTLGDCNDDGEVNVNDVTALQRHICGLSPLNEVLLKAADVEGSGQVDVNDVTYLQRVLAEFDDATL